METMPKLCHFCKSETKIKVLSKNTQTHTQTQKWNESMCNREKKNQNDRSTPWKIEIKTLAIHQLLWLPFVPHCLSLWLTHTVFSSSNTLSSILLKIEYRSSLVALWLKDQVLSLLWFWLLLQQGWVRALAGELLHAIGRSGREGRGREGDEGKGEENGGEGRGERERLMAASCSCWPMSLLRICFSHLVDLKLIENFKIST